MCKEYDFTSALQTNISLADDWLRGMALGAERSGRTVQYCMPYAHDLLSAAAYPAVTNARATGDYFHTRDGRQWAIGATALFYDALNILPFKVFGACLLHLIRTSTPLLHLRRICNSLTALRQSLSLSNTHSCLPPLTFLSPLPSTGRLLLLQPRAARRPDCRP